MAGARFKPNRSAAKQLLDDSMMGAALGRFAEEGAELTETSAPKIVRGKGSLIFSETAKTAHGWEGRIIVRSPFWHFPEYGHSRYPPRPYLRPSVQKLLSRYGGRFK